MLPEILDPKGTVRFKANSQPNRIGLAAVRHDVYALTVDIEHRIDSGREKARLMSVRIERGKQASSIPRRFFSFGCGKERALLLSLERDRELLIKQHELNERLARAYFKAYQFVSIATALEIVARRRETALVAEAEKCYLEARRQLEALLPLANAVSCGDLVGRFLNSI
jgi:hypothetical protein